MPNSECSVGSEVTSELYQQQLVKAHQGCAIAQYELATMLSIGKEIRRDYTMAFKWCCQAAEQNYAPAQNKLGIMYELGQGVPKNTDTAIEWYQKSAEQNHASAQFNFARMLYNNKRRCAEALTWYNKAAEQGHERAQYIIGLIYTGIFRTPKNEEIASEFFYKVAIQGYSPAQNKLRQAAEEGYAWAQCKLSKAADQGHAWAENLLNKAIENNHDWAKDILNNQALNFVNINLLVNNISDSTVSRLSGNMASLSCTPYKEPPQYTDSKNILNISQDKNSVNH